MFAVAVTSEPDVILPATTPPAPLSVPAVPKVQVCNPATLLLPMTAPVLPTLICVPQELPAKIPLLICAGLSAPMLVAHNS